MSDTATHVFRVELRPDLYREIEVFSGMPLDYLAAAIVEVFGFGTPPYMTMADVCAAFGVSPSTEGAKGTHRLRWAEASPLRSRLDATEHDGQKSTGMDGRGQWLLGGPAQRPSRGSGNCL